MALPPIDPLTQVGLKAAAPIVGNALSSLTSKMLDLRLMASERVARDFRLGFSDFLEASFNRCQQVKTLISGDQPISLTEIYVNLHLTCAETNIEDVDLVNRMNEFKKVVVTGTGGAGKSMFMKYLTVCRFENPQGKIPLFVELRNINGLTIKDLLQFTFHSCQTANSRVSFSTFEKVLQAGGFVLIFDGFDEVNKEDREEVEHQILDIGRRYPEALMVVSSRFDKRFKSWSNFYVFGVDKLNRSQAIDVIEKSRYDSGIKKRFIREIKSLWETHETFLSIPLLATIMLITFGKFSEISPKATLFYKLAFQTLLREHDSGKEQFKRDLYCPFDLDDFEKCFAAFCAISYTEGKHSFTKSQAVEYARQAMVYGNLKADPDSFVKDLIENVCMLQEDGLDLVFIHRSFQEYFSAVFCVSYHEHNVRELFDKVATKEFDSTLGMIKEIDQSKLEIQWLIPKLQYYIDSLSESLKGNSPSDAISWLFSSCKFSEDLSVEYFMVNECNHSSIIGSISKIYPDFYDRINYYDLFMSFHEGKPKDAIAKASMDERRRVEILESHSAKSKAESTIKFTREDDDWLRRLGILKIMKRMLVGFEELKSSIDDGRAVQGAILKI